ncbi:MAG: hypothetical protein KKC02_09020 [Gammaproteobacteria bacterium]|nr:hypothetical protein [Alphaproteobacteria bacterium]MBU1805185.1 hypothetical protein [Gammaproteobacteria bacterium]
MRKLPFKDQTLDLVLDSTDSRWCLLVEQVLPILGYRDTDALRRRVGDSEMDSYFGKPSVKVRALIDLVLSRRRKDAEDFGEWIIDQFGDDPDRQRWAVRQKRLGVKASRVEEITFGQLCAAMGVRSDNRVTFHNALRVASDVVRSVGLPGFCLGGERFTLDVVGALAVRSLGGARAALTPGRAAALAALSKALSRGEWVEEEALVQIREGLDG